MVIDFNNQIAFTNLQNKSFLKAETEPQERKKGESVFGLKTVLGQKLAAIRDRLWSQKSEVCTNLDNQASLGGFLAVLEQCVGATTGEVVVESIKGLKVVLTPCPAGHLPFKARIWDWTENIDRISHFTKFNLNVPKEIQFWLDQCVFVHPMKIIKSKLE